MKIRKHKHFKLEQHGWPITVSGRTKKWDYNSDWSSYSREYPFRSIKWYAITHRRQSWRSYK